MFPDGGLTRSTGKSPCQVAVGKHMESIATRHSPSHWWLPDWLTKPHVPLAGIGNVRIVAEGDTHTHGITVCTKLHKERDMELVWTCIMNNIWRHLVWLETIWNLYILALQLFDWVMNGIKRNKQAKQIVSFAIWYGQTMAGSHQAEKLPSKDGAILHHPPSSFSRTTLFHLSPFNIVLKLFWTIPEKHWMHTVEPCQVEMMPFTARV